MRKMNKTIFVVVLVLAGTISAYALDIKGTAPTFKGSDPNYQQLADALNNQLKSAFNDALNDLRDQTAGIDKKPEDFIQAWGNSAVFASQGASQRGYGGYKLFAVTAGPMIGLQLPGSPFSIMDELDSLSDKLKDDGDIKLGINPQLLNVRVGMNMSQFLLKNLYLGVQVGYMSLDNLMDGFSFSNFSLGVTANYQLLPPLSLAGLVLWRGVNVGSGLIYQGTTIGLTVGLDSINQDIGAVSAPGMSNINNLKLKLDPELALNMDISTVTIPLEATTAIRLLYFLNLSLGVGVDLGLGTSAMKVGMNGDINVDGNLPSQIQRADSEKISVDAGGDMSPSVFNLKFMTGIGFNFGPVVLDIPVIFYLDSGYSVGLTLGVVW